MANKLYPSLEEFYINNNIEDGDEDIWYNLSDQKLYRTKKRANKCKEIADDILNKNIIVDEEEATPIIPSAPPLEEISWDDLRNLEYQPDYSLFDDQSLPPPYSDHDPLSSNSWIDDLQPDYDDDCTTLGDREDINILINDLDIKEPMGTHLPRKDYSTGITQGASRKVDACNGRSISEEKTGNKVLDKKLNINVNERNSADYTAWVSWRKQVNRQLAALILLRRGGHVRLATVDLSRKPLSKTSMKEVFHKATNDSTQEAMTSLNGKPYIMYGIPRVALAKDPTLQ